MFFKKKGARVKLKDVMPHVKKKGFVALDPDSPIEEVVRIITESGNDSILYVTNDEYNLLGTVSLDELARHIFSSNHELRVHSRRLMDMVTAETARHIMKKQPPYAKEDEDIETVIKKMIRSQVKHMAVLDDSNRMTGDISMKELIRIILRLNQEEE